MSYISWNIKAQDASLVKNICSKIGCSEILSRILINRDIVSANEAENFLNPSSDVLYDPFLINDMDKAVERINLSIKQGEKICIYGDYDVDGITSVSVLYLYLRNFTQNIIYYIPDRFSQGYGINNNALDKIRDMGCSLIITVDTGISAISEIEYAKQIGIDIVITDHHECQSNIPDACAVVNPKRRDSSYPFSNLAGVGVVYKLICAMDCIRECNLHNEYIDLVAVGTIADIMPLVNENRYIVKAGLKKISSNPSNGLKCLIDNCSNNTDINSGTVSFALAPRINAAGRMESAEVAVKLFITENPNEAKEIADYLCKLNVERQKTENAILKEAVEIINKHDLNNKYKALVLWNKGWHSGVIGIVASKLKDKYNKPVVLFSVDEYAKGSGRSVIPFNLYEAFEKTGDMLMQYGGHKYAAGVLIKNEKLYEFRDRLSELVDEFLNKNTLTHDIEIECELSHNNVNCKTVREINKLQPYGKSNEIPLFCIRNVKICDVFPTSNNKHLRIKFDLGSKIVTGFYFCITPDEFDYRENDFVDIVCELNENEYRNIKSVQFIIRDIRYPDRIIDLLESKRRYCDKGDNIIPSMLPSRKDIATVYKSFLINLSKGRNMYNLDTVANVINKDTVSGLNYEKIYFSIKILTELGVIEGTVSGIDYTVKNIPKDKTFDLNDSIILSSIYDKAGVKFGNST